MPPFFVSVLYCWKKKWQAQAQFTAGARHYISCNNGGKGDRREDE